ncbi:hypothetical protein AB406_1414 [Riemerella anatipestifer]|uniref:Uncharacterized protein n=1 Tax=Riemerella anatipestifer TaxID=34085 RepID=A0A1S7DTD1_RIEAN|nr:hypothetical protein AB406_1414 [Riemerella anatipestifer]
MVVLGKLQKFFSIESKIPSLSESKSTRSEGYHHQNLHSEKKMTAP